MTLEGNLVDGALGINSRVVILDEDENNSVLQKKYKRNSFMAERIFPR